MKYIGCGVFGECNGVPQYQEDNQTFGDLAVSLHEITQCQQPVSTFIMFRAWRKGRNGEPARWLRARDPEYRNHVSGELTPALRALLTDENRLDLDQEVGKAQFAFPDHCVANDVHVIVVFPPQMRQSLWKRLTSVRIWRRSAQGSSASAPSTSRAQHQPQTLSRAPESMVEQTPSRRRFGWFGLRSTTASGPSSRLLKKLAQQ